MGKILIFLLNVCILFCSSSSNADWQRATGSIEYNNLTCGGIVIHAVRFKPNNVSISNFVQPPPGNFAENILINKNTDVVINGAYFTPEVIPIGLLINKGTKLSRLHKTSWWSIFYLKNNLPNIVLPNSIDNLNKIDFAIQAGPRLIIRGRTPKLKESEGKTPRSAIGIDKSNNVILATSAPNVLFMKDWAMCLRNKNGLDLISAMNLDGGSSSQMSFKKNGEQINYRGLSPVPSFILIKNK